MLGATVTSRRRLRASAALIGGLATIVVLSGCAAALPAISAAASVAGAMHSFLQVGEDVVALSASACQSMAQLPPDAADPWYAPICGDLRPSRLDAGTSLWLAEGVGRKKATVGVNAMSARRMLPAGYTWYNGR